ncbi:S53 family peptidase [Leekyejoonella antrihumi]|uniref:Peptidase S53 domain-containing protein n=1 Tax=Leekyejoonella antrihumi TaxID=1660198 RepID=A0A563E5T8_9MICO|nr:S53 family peptidase [Leekyejoonella antrihumi]TWP37928.1 hypothetical protein FGL98_04250 [Leekyejoonella antrihumi]
MKRRNLAALTAAATAVAVIPAAGALAASAGNDGRTVLPNSGVVHASGLSVKGAAASTQPMSFTFQLPLRNQDLANRLVQKSVVLSPAQYRTYFAPSAAQLTKVSKWAKSQGFTVTQISRDSGQVTVSGTVSHVNKAFKVQMHRATLDGKSGLTTNASPSVPASLGLSGIAGLNSVHHMTTDHVVQPNWKKSASAKGMVHTGGLGQNMKPLANGASDGSTSCSAYWGDHLYPKSKKYSNESNVMCGYMPADLQKMYGSAAYKTTKASLGILLWDNNKNELAQTNTYMKKAGYPTLASYTAVTNPYTNDPACAGAQSEQDLDVQSSHAIAPGASITYYGAASCNDSDLTAMLQKAVDAHKVTTISMSFGTSSDQGLTTADKNSWDRPLLQASLTGMSVFAATGDSGDNSRKTKTNDGKPHIGYPATSYYVAAVGGTSVGMKSTGSLSALTGWEDGFYSQASPGATTFPDVTNSYPPYGAGGGISETWSMPAWQKGKVGGYSSTMRVVPDIAAVADPFTGYTIYTNDGGLTYEPIGGTSLATPVTAALVGLGKTANKYKVGNIAPKLYQLAGTSAITDVNGPNKAGVYYPMTTTSGLVIGFDTHHQSLVTKAGWDNVTGVGTPHGAAFIQAIK